MNALNSHDTARAATVMIDGGQRLGAALMFTMPGVPVDALAFVRETAGSSVLVVVARAAAEVKLQAGMLTDAQFGALGGDPAFRTAPFSTAPSSTDDLSAVPLGGGQIRADDPAPGALICTRGPAAGVWVLPGTPLPGATPQSAPHSGAPESAP